MVLQCAGLYICELIYSLQPLCRVALLSSFSDEEPEIQVVNGSQHLSPKNLVLKYEFLTSIIVTAFLKTVIGM